MGVFPCCIYLPYYRPPTRKYFIMLHTLTVLLLIINVIIVVTIVVNNITHHSQRQCSPTSTKHGKIKPLSHHSHQSLTEPEPESSSLYLSLLLLSIAKDIEPNPGPVKYPCQICKKAVKWTTPSVCCDSCELWYHKDCMFMNTAVYEGLRNVSWYCCACGLPNFSTSLFDTICLDDSNSFSPLSDNPLSPITPEANIGSPAATSSPKVQKRGQYKKNKQMFVKHLPPARSEYRVPQRPITKTGTKEGQLTQRYY